MGVITQGQRRHYFGSDADKSTIAVGCRCAGDLYFTTDTKLLYVWDGVAWVVNVDLAVIATDIVPDATNIRSLGSALKHWAYLYTRSLFVDPAFGVSSDLNPDTQNAYDLGGGAWPWRNLKALNAYLGTLKQDVAADAGIKVDGVDISEHIHTAAAGDAPKILVTGLANDAVETLKIKDLNVTKGKAELGFGRYVGRSVAAPDFQAGDFTADGAWHVDGLDLSAILPAGAVAVVLSVTVLDDAASSIFRIQRAAADIGYAFEGVTQVANIEITNNFIIPIDANRLLDYWATNLTWTLIDVSVVGYFI